jgi:hypothetical protein
VQAVVRDRSGDSDADCDSECRRSEASRRDRHRRCAQDRRRHRIRRVCRQAVVRHGVSLEASHEHSLCDGTARDGDGDGAACDGDGDRAASGGDSDRTACGGDCTPCDSHCDPHGDSDSQCGGEASGSQGDSGRCYGAGHKRDCSAGDGDRDG